MRFTYKQETKYLEIFRFKDILDKSNRIKDFT